MTTPILHPRTKEAVNTHIARPAHGLILVGASGHGKHFLATWIASETGSTPYLIEKPDDKSTISIEQIRDLYNLTRSGAALTVIIKDSHLMGTEAQNAFLKLLEEPPKNVRFILTAENTKGLLQTIRSRTQHITVLKPEKKQLEKHLADNSSLDVPEIEALLLTSNRKIGRLSELLQDQEALASHLEAVLEAKKYYVSTAYDRHLLCIAHGYEKAWISSLLELLTIIVQTLLKQPSADLLSIEKLTQQADLIEQTSKNILRINGNPKIHLVKLSEKL